MLFSANDLYRDQYTSLQLKNKKVHFRRRHNLEFDMWLCICWFYWNRCLSCGIQADPWNLHVDHVLPIKHNGKKIIANVQPLCQRCNQVKGTKSIDLRWDNGKRMIEYIQATETFSSSKLSSGLMFTSYEVAIDSFNGTDLCTQLQMWGI